MKSLNLAVIAVSVATTAVVAIWPAAAAAQAAESPAVTASATGAGTQGDDTGWGLIGAHSDDV